MPFPSEPRPQLGHATTAPSPLRQASNASTSSSVYTTYSNPFPPSRSSTISSNGSIVYSNAAVGHKRGISEATGLSPNAARHWTEAVDINSTSPKSLRPSLKTLAQAPMAPRFDQAKGADKSHSRSHSIDGLGGQLDGPPSHNTSTQHSLAISRSDSTRYAPGDRPSGTSAMSRLAASSTILEKPDLHSLQKSTTKHLRTLSQFAEEVAEEDFAIKSPEQEVVGMHGRRRLKRASSTRGQRSAGLTGYGGRTWMDQQRQYLQAYEYLCHIGEAKEWIEDVMHKQIPPIVQLEEALRDGVTLAEVVQGLNPDKAYRIFRNPKLQFRHSDNIAIFFRYLSDVELPELFRFELVDLYAKKNIPKVIYCIHALSWLLYRKGIVNFRIGNLVGQLHFDVHELEQTQKGLDKAGISMPNFSGMVDTFGEPSMISDIDTTETEEEKSHRELMEADTPITDLQAQMRACILRSQLGTVMQNLWDSESLIIKLQSHIRGDWMREIVRYRLDMRKFAINLQSAARAFGVRTQSRRKLELCRADDSVATLQSIVRGYRSRAATQRTTTILQDNAHGVRTFQALVKGAMKRWEVADQYYGTRNAEKSVASLQSMARGFVARKRDDMQRSVVADSEHVIVALQSFCRRRIVKEHLSRQSKDLKLSEPTLKKLQAVSRASLSRASQGALISSITEHEATLKTFQSICRAYKTRLSRQKTSSALLVHNSATTFIQARCRANVVINHVAGLKSDLSLCQTSLLDSQSCIRGYTARQEILKSLRSLDSTLPTITSLQSASRGFLSRQQVFDVLCELQDVEPKIISLQTHCRGMLLRLSISADFEILAENELAIIDLQAAIKGFTVRRNFVEKQKFYNENIKKVIKIQSFVRARQQGEAYKSLTSGINPPVSTIKSFIHLLNDSEFDFDGEIEIERLRKTVVQQVRQNELAEQYIDQLDIKIALLVKNKITLDEVVKHQKHFGGNIGSFLSNTDISSKDPFDLRALNKQSRRKLEQYQEFFFLLQTQPQYLARLFKRIRERGVQDNDFKKIELLTMGIFGFAQKSREEYYLLKMIARSTKEEVESCGALQNYLRTSSFGTKIFAHYIRSPRDRRFLRDMLGPLIKESVIENEALDLESDPLQIYRSAINNEELSTGRRSSRNLDIPREEAIRDPETRETFKHHLQDLRDIADEFFVVLEEQLHRMPYGVRFIAQQMFELLTAHFPDEEPNAILQVVGQWIWKSYLLVPMTQPESWGVVDRGLSPLQRRNIGEVAKVLGQVASGRSFGGDNLYLQPLNSYVTEAIERLQDIWSNLIAVASAESQFDIDEYNDLYARTKPTLYIKLADIFATHQLVASEVAYICPSAEDVLREVIRELGNAKNNESEMVGVSSAEICLTLSPKYHDMNGPDSTERTLFMETKRCVLYIIRVQSGANLLDVMIRPIGQQDDERWRALVQEELASHGGRKRGAYSDATALSDVTSMTYIELKRVALENLLQLESTGRISRHNHYQDLLNAIAVDIRTKHRRRIQRARELEGVQATLAALDEKARWLEQQLKSYNDYIEQAMVTLQRAKGKKRFLLPFTKQYNHERELARSGRVPKFGSFKYSARQLAEKGVLLSWAPFPEQRWEKVNLTISSDEVGIFHLEGSAGSMMIPGASASVPLDDLLQAQFNNCQYMNLFGNGSAGQSDGVLRLNVNLFLHLLFKKFYRDE